MSDSNLSNQPSSLLKRIGVFIVNCIALMTGIVTFRRKDK